MQQTVDYTAGISLRKLLPDSQIVGGDDIRVLGCCADSRDCRPGDLFVAIEGTAEDGHAFAAAAVKSGASAILAERILPSIGVPVCIVNDTRSAYGRLCQELAGAPSQHMQTIGVTGTNGKTTTCWLISSILKAAGHQVGVTGTLGYCDGSRVDVASHTTPPAPRLAQWMARMSGNGCSHCVLEISSHALVQRRVAGVALTAACLTNIQRDHLDYHGCVANYRAAKAQIFEHLAPEGVAILNIDDPAVAGMTSKLTHPLLTVGIDGPADITATIVERFHSEQTFLITAGGETSVVRTHMVGKHHVLNCLVATALGLSHGIDLPTIVRGLEAVSYVPGRLERLECGQPYGVFVDYAHTPDALIAALDALRPVTDGRVICVFGAGGDRDREKRPLMGRVVAAKADVPIVTSDNPRSECPSAIIDQITAAVDDSSAVVVELDRRQAIRKAIDLARPGDCVLIAGKGHENYQIVGSRRYPFDDREVTHDILRELADADELLALDSEQSPEGNVP